MIDVIVVENEDGFTRTYKAKVYSYKDYYKLGGFDLFDVVNVEWNGDPISIYVDDEGLFKPNNYGRMVEGYPQPLFGTLIIAGGVDDEGETLSVPKWINPVNVIDHIADVEFITRGN